jgi:hypothetical protein
MALKKTTVMVDENDLAIIKEAAKRDGKPESEYFREAFHLAALIATRRSKELDIPSFDFTRHVAEGDVSEAMREHLTGPENR